nr:MAG TPA: hypothetical protein [Caudoviricetes sp.]
MLSLSNEVNNISVATKVFIDFPLYAHTILCISDNVNRFFRFFLVLPTVL